MDEHFLRIAIQLSLEKMQAGEGGPFGAIVVYDNTIIGKGWNRVLSTNDPTAHAEIVAIRNSCAKLQTFDLKGCILYSSCEPCPMCLAAVYWSSISRVVYGADRNDAEESGFKDRLIYDELQLENKDKSIDMKQILRQESLVPLTVWKKMEDKTKY